jgi:glucose-6-phosphate isomerase
MSDFSIAQSFISDSTRAKRYTITTDDLMVDYSKHLIDDQVMQNLIQLARECKLDEAISSMMS